MTPRSLFMIILKSLGILFIKEFLLLIPQFLTVFLYFQRGVTFGVTMWLFLTTAVQLIIYSLVFYYLIFKTEQVIDKLNLDKGFSEEKFYFNAHRSSVLSVVMIITGILVLVDSIPSFCKQLFNYIQQTRMIYSSSAPETGKLMIAAVQILIGLLLIGSQRQIVNFIERKRRTTAIENEQQV